MDEELKLLGMTQKCPYCKKDFKRVASHIGYCMTRRLDQARQDEKRAEEVFRERERRERLEAELKEKDQFIQSLASQPRVQVINNFNISQQTLVDFVNRVAQAIEQLSWINQDKDSLMRDLRCNMNMATSEEKEMWRAIENGHHLHDPQLTQTIQSARAYLDNKVDASIAEAKRRRVGPQITFIE